jgi:hypothetical protein
VLSGKEVVRAIEGVGSGSGKTAQPVLISNCGEVEVVSTSPKSKGQ